MGPKHDKEMNIRGHWPWMSSIGYYDENDEWYHLCGATLISHTHFLTAAHCASFKSKWKIHVGDFNFSLLRAELRGIDVEVRKITTHPQHLEKSPYYDVAIVETDSVEFSDVIYPICLPPDSSTRRDYARVDLLGWGSSNEHGKTSKLLKRVSLTLYPDKFCNETHSQHGLLESKIKKFVPNLFPSHLACAGIEFGMQGACKGDSGGPLQFYDTEAYRYFQVAVVHGALQHCGDPLFPGVYVRLEDPAILNFIKFTLDGNNNVDAFESEWHLIGSFGYAEKAEIFNWQTGEQCSLNELSPIRKRLNDRTYSNIATIDNTPIFCNQRDEMCQKLSVSGKVWMPLKSSPQSISRADSLKLVSVPGKGLGLFSFFYLNNGSYNVEVHLLDHADGNWAKVGCRAGVKYSQCIVQINETTTVLLGAYQENSIIGTFDWSSNEYVEREISWHEEFLFVRNCAIARDEKKTHLLSLSSQALKNIKVKFLFGIRPTKNSRLRKLLHLEMKVTETGLKTPKLLPLTMEQNSCSTEVFLKNQETNTVLKKSLMSSGNSTLCLEIGLI